MTIARKSVEVGTTTTVTQELLKQINNSVLNDEEIAQALTQPKKKPKRRNNKRKKDSCTDLRIAELGKSTEIAHMTLRRRSEALLVIKSDSHIRALKRSSLRNDSGLSGDTEKWSDEGYSSQDTYRRHWLDRRLGSLLKMPYVFFKENILARSSMISVMLTNRAQKKSALKKLKCILHDEIACHHSRGVKQLYPTIKKQKTPYKLGWLHLVDRMSKDLGCKHYRKSHSYRCMRSRVMRSAGPTRSELAVYRRKLKKFFAVNIILKRIISLNHQYETMLRAQTRHEMPRLKPVIIASEQNSVQQIQKTPKKNAV
ncbi:uncharacterized protein LOC126974804 isoform X2 [Leptidea sinapis]|nr:uncharacterized protein LOC126974804 isoform X2 [Leptidea sinapis]